MRLKNRSVITTILGCLAFLCIPILTSPDLDSELSFLKVGGFQHSFLNYCLLLLFFFVNYHLLLPLFYYKNKKAVYFVWVVIFFVIILYIPKLLPLNPMHHPHGMMPPGKEHFGKHIPARPNFFDYFIIIPYLLVLALTFLLRTNLQLKEVKNEKLKAEVSYLKAQMNPHFLFNTLNSLYALTIIKSDEAPNAVLKLSGMMRYVVTESAQDFVPLEKEINYIKDYIELQKLRMDQSTAFSFEINGNPMGKAIAPLLLIPFIENAFKYGLNPEEDSEITILLEINDGQLTLEVKNKMVIDDIPEEYKTEKGIENTTKRLAFIYPDQHQLEISEAGGYYRIRLLLELL